MLKIFALTFTFCLLFSTTFGINPPVYPTKYRVTGIWQIPNGNVTEPILVNFDGDSDHERVDYYSMNITTALGTDIIRDDLNKTYELRIQQDHQGCTIFQNAGPSSTAVDSNLPNVLPNLTDSAWVYMGESVVRGIHCYYWQMNITEYNKSNSYTFYTDADGNPVRYLLHGYNIVFHSHYDIYILDYYSYEPNVNDANCYDIPPICNSTETVYSDKVAPVPLRALVSGLRNSRSFNSYVNEYNKDYTGNEYEKRKLIYEENLRRIDELNSQRSFKLAPNHFADLTLEEFKSLMLPKKYSEINVQLKNAVPYQRQNLDLPDSFSWLDYGAVSLVKDQGVCGSCWSFATTGATEGAYFLATGKMETFSEQALMACSWAEGNSACEGGMMYGAYDWMTQNGLTTEELYPYLCMDSYCGYDKSMQKIGVSHYLNVSVSGDIELTKEMLYANGPLAIAIDAGHFDFVYYQSGIYSSKDCHSDFDGLDHGVLLVGWGEEDGTPFWIIKNSWSELWGDKGYCKMAQANNMCGVCTVPSVPVITTHF
ncbi:hypothetical protein M0811_08199 [Anaeramoeba ignava]|uniref:Uncharacterized protein n=1 Tax=Anaeramoeba ignava TaxID=1746090 RepID=A0A9Q0LID9_ANAIG|nr:hypothetical protein M0811_08199 [Anaeramoeba ignava]|eukprot:Anaeramoba_ignava/a218629_239.p1 GENE.a218629_239~~a218629_239.p1  ORF type:complete len:539 (+),score=136.39 a218629_239:6-1622(+)